MKLETFQITIPEPGDPVLFIDTVEDANTEMGEGEIVSFNKSDLTCTVKVTKPNEGFTFEEGVLDFDGCHFSVVGGVINYHPQKEVWIFNVDEDM